MIERDVDALLAFIDSRHDVPHAWGRRANDCAGYALDAAKAQTGQARAAKLTWSSRAEGLRVIRKCGGLEAAFDRYFQRIAPAMAQRGDIAGVADPVFGVHPMIVEGETLVGPGDTGNRRLPRPAMVAAWSVTAPAPRKKRAKSLAAAPSTPTGGGE